ncbi:MAG TPA: 3-deoxy-manno-octulosonate cytidylyltransferase [Acidobacteriaceae bacterium]|jgi:3-deoxy-manno-octulosonate cytidylyltransferase (CMP-KDO synthetase)|nr:3-deoxy-manno-octulosonate cytidylyltransferase [Acidobacteriaceae bacterium]
MKATNRVLGVIPARLASTRLPRKVLREIAGRPMLSWVYEAAVTAGVFDAVIVATDSDEVAAFGRAQGWDVRLTSPTLPSGTDRVHAIAQQEAADIYVNIQGDEPLLRREHFEALLRPFTRPDISEKVEVATVMTPCAPENIANPNAVKVVVAHDGRALYFSRATIPWDRDATGNVAYWKHLGLYAYRKPALDRFSTLSPSRLEITERLEQLRFLENGTDLYVEPVEFDTIGVDTEADLAAVAALLQSHR